MENNQDILKKYLICKNCFQVELFETWKEVGHRRYRCIHCKKVYKQFYWPEDESREILRFILNIKSEDPRYTQMAVVFLSSALELMLEKLLSTMAFGMFAGPNYYLIEELILDSYSGRNKMFELYKKIGYGSFHSVVQEMRKGKFLKYWDDIVYMRNKVVHGKLNREKDKLNLSPKDVKEFIDDALFVFSRLNNIYNKETFLYSAAVDKAHRKETEKLIFKK